MAIPQYDMMNLNRAFISTVGNVGGTRPQDDNNVLVKRGELSIRLREKQVRMENGGNI